MSIMDDFPGFIEKVINGQPEAIGVLFFCGWILIVAFVGAYASFRSTDNQHKQNKRCKKSGILRYRNFVELGYSQKRDEVFYYPVVSIECDGVVVEQFQITKRVYEDEMQALVGNTYDVRYNPLNPKEYYIFDSISFRAKKVSRLLVSLYALIPAVIMILIVITQIPV